MIGTFAFINRVFVDASIVLNVEPGGKVNGFVSCFYYFDLISVDFIISRSLRLSVFS